MRYVALLLFAAALHAVGPRRPLGLDLYRPEPEDNRRTSAKVALGRRLFHDLLLSRDGSLSCATCHDPAAHLLTAELWRKALARLAATAIRPPSSTAHG